MGQGVSLSEIYNKFQKGANQRNFKYDIRVFDEKLKITKKINTVFRKDGSYFVDCDIELIFKLISDIDIPYNYDLIIKYDKKIGNYILDDVIMNGYRKELYLSPESPKGWLELNEIYIDLLNIDYYSKKFDKSGLMPFNEFKSKFGISQYNSQKVSNYFESYLLKLIKDMTVIEIDMNPTETKTCKAVFGADNIY